MERGGIVSWGLSGLQEICVVVNDWFGKNGRGCGLQGKGGLE